MLFADLRMVDKKRNILERFKGFIQSNYLENGDTNSYQINCLAVINVQNKGFRELQEDEEEEDLDRRRRGRSHFCRLYSFVKCCLFFNLFYMRDRY